MKTAEKDRKGEKKGEPIEESLLKGGESKYVVRTMTLCRRNHNPSSWKCVRRLPSRRSLFIILTRFSLPKRKEKNVGKIWQLFTSNVNYSTHEIWRNQRFLPKWNLNSTLAFWWKSNSACKINNPMWDFKLHIHVHPFCLKGREICEVHC